MPLNKQEESCVLTLVIAGRYKSKTKVHMKDRKQQQQQQVVLRKITLVNNPGKHMGILNGPQIVWSDRLLKVLS